MNFPRWSSLPIARLPLVACLALLFTTTSAAAAAEPEIEFVGVVASGQGHRLVLKTKTGEPQWIAVGAQFAGYTVAAYEPKAETAVLTRDGRELRLRLRDAKVAHGGASTELAPEIRAAILNNIRMLAAAAEQVYQDTGKTMVTYDDLVTSPDKPNNYVRGPLESKAGENYRTMQFVRGKTLQVTTAGGHTVSFVP